MTKVLLLIAIPSAKICALIQPAGLKPCSGMVRMAGPPMKTYHHGFTVGLVLPGPYYLEVVLL